MIEGAIAVCGASALLAAPAFGATRFAEPAGDGPEPCLAADPCEIEDAVEGPAPGDVGNGDEIVLESGNYPLGTTVLDPADAITVRALDASDRPQISGSGSFLVQSGANLVLRDLDFSHAAPSANASTLFLRGAGALVERVSVTMGNGGIACNVVDGVLRDSFCRGENSVGAAGAFISSPVGTYSADFVNVTAVATGGGIGLVVNASVSGTHNSVSARNTIASSVFVSNTGGATSSASATLISSNFPASSTNGGANTAVTAPGPPNQTAPPQLGDLLANDFHQQTGSPTINAGAADAMLGTQDLDLTARIQGPAPDIGADEFPEVPATPPVDPPVDPPDTKAPTVTITSKPKPKVKTKKKTAKFSIGFSADETSTFRCSLDGKAPATCSSPFTGKVKKGKHTVSVVATDAASNASPAATATWTVKRKKPRR